MQAGFKADSAPTAVLILAFAAARHPPRHGARRRALHVFWLPGTDKDVDDAPGFRNPWRFSFDRKTGDLWVADVGQDKYEEVNFEPAGGNGGLNYGWNTMEGTHCFKPSEGCSQAGLVLPVSDYSHDDGCSVTGGYVYRGAKEPKLEGAYFFTDYCGGVIWALTRDSTGNWQRTEVLSSKLRISSFGEDQSGELYVVSQADGTIYRMRAK